MPALLHDSNSDGVSEVVGQILIFGILSTVLILALLGFNVAREGTAEQVAEVRAESIAQRIAGVVVDGALFAEQTDADTIELRLPMELPDDLEGQGYSITLNEDDVTVTTGGTTVAAALFSSGQPTDLVVCAMPARIGGSLDVRVTSNVGSIDPADCPNLGAATRAILLENPA